MNFMFTHDFVMLYHYYYDNILGPKHVAYLILETI
jgi:hypothetical protein